MAEEIHSLKWKAGFDLTQIRKDQQELKKILSGVGIKIDILDEDALPTAKKVIEKVKENAQEAQKEISEGKVSIVTDEAAKESKKKVKEVIDYSKQQVKEYFESLAAYKDEGIVPTTGMNRGAPKIVRPATVSDDPISKARDAYIAADQVTKDYIDELVRLNMELRQVSQEQSKLNKELKDGGGDNSEYVQQMSILKAKQDQLTESIKNVTERQKDYLAVTNATEGSLKEKKVLLSQLKQQYEDLSPAEQKSAKIGGEMRNQIASLSAEIKKMDPTKVEKTTLAFTELRRLKQELASGVYTGAELVKAQQRAAQLEKQIVKVNNEIKITGSQTAAVDALTDGVRGMVGGFTAVSGAIGIFTNDNEKAQKVIQSVTSAMSLLYGIQELSRVLNENSGVNQYLQMMLKKNAADKSNAANVTLGTIAETANTGAQRVNVAATELDTAAKLENAAANEAATAATWSLTAAMEANPFGVVLLAVTALTAGIVYLSSKTDKATEIQDALNKKMTEGRDSVIQQRVELERLLVTARDENASKQDRLKAIEDLNKANVPYLGFLTLENINTKAATQAVNDYIGSLERLAKAKAFQDQLVENYKDINQIKSKTAQSINRDNERLGLPKLSDEKLEETVMNRVGDKVKDIQKSNDYILKQLNDQQKTEDHVSAKQQKAQAAQLNHNKAYYEQLLANQQKEKEGYADSAEGLKKIDSINKQIAETKKKIAQFDDPDKIKKTGDAAARATERANEAARKSAQGLTDILNKVGNVNEGFLNFGAPKGDSYLNQIRAKFKQISDEIKKFNADPKNKIKVSENVIDELEKAEKEAEQRAKYITQTADLQKELEKQKGLYKEFEDWKNKYGKESAITQFGDQSNFKEQIENQISILKKSETDSNKDIVEARIKIYLDMYKQLTKMDDDYNRSILDNALKSAQTQSDRLTKAKLDYETGRGDLITAGASPEQLEQYEKQYQKIISAINKDFQEIDIDKVLQATTATTKRELQSQIAYLNQYLDNTKTLSDDQKRGILKNISDLRAKMLSATNGDGFADNGFITELKKLQNEIDETKSHLKDLQEAKDQINKNTEANGGIISEEDAKKLALINSQLDQTKDKLKALTSFRTILSAGLIDVANIAQAAADGFHEMASATADLDEGLSDTLQTMGDISQAAADIGKGGLSILKGDPASIISGIASIGKGIAGLFSIGKKARESEKKAMAELKKYQDGLVLGQIEYNQALREAAEIQSGIVKGTQEELKAQIELNKEKIKGNAEMPGIEQDLATLRDKLTKEGQQITGEHTKKYGGVFGIGRKTKVVQEFGGLGITADMTDDQIAAQLQLLEDQNKLTDATKEWADSFIDANKELKDTKQNIADLTEQLTEAFSGTTADNIAQAIADGLRNGKKSFSDFGDDFNKMISDSLFSSIKDTLLSGSVSKIWEQFQAYASDGGPLTADEIASLRNQFNQAIDQGNKLLDQAMEAFPDLADTLQSADGLSKSIQGITEDTADALTGLFRNQYDYTKKINANLLLMLKPIQNIEKNTADTVKRLDQAITELKKVVTNTTSKPINTTRDNGQTL